MLQKYTKIHLTNFLTSGTFWVNYLITIILIFFFEWSLHELSVYDVPAQIEVVAEKTGRAGNIIYIGHSLGTTTAFIYAIDKMEQAHKNLRAIIALAPIGSLHNCPHFFDGKYLTTHIVAYGQVRFEQFFFYFILK